MALLSEEEERGKVEGATGGSGRKRRLRRGQRRDELFWWHKEGEMSVYDENPSLLALEEHIKELAWRKPRNIITLVSPPEDAGPTEWVYEHVRQMVIALNHMLLAMTHCHCPKMV